MCADSSCSPEVKKYREAVWDMFQSEAKYLTKFLQPLELVYKNFLEELHFHQILKVADGDKIFANISELCEVNTHHYRTVLYTCVCVCVTQCANS